MSRMLKECKRVMQGNAEKELNAQENRKFNRKIK